jgi:alanine transaminase
VCSQNIYCDKPFVSLKKVLRDLGADYKDFELVSFHSTSKGLLGECGRRGGYMEMVGVDPAVQVHVYVCMCVCM